VSNKFKTVKLFYSKFGGGNISEVKTRSVVEKKIEKIKKRIKGKKGILDFANF
jgi:hypothetical protein